MQNPRTLGVTLTAAGVVFMIGVVAPTSVGSRRGVEAANAIFASSVADVASTDILCHGCNAEDGQVLGPWMVAQPTGFTYSAVLGADSGTCEISFGWCDATQWCAWEATLTLRNFSTVPVQFCDPYGNRQILQPGTDTEILADWTVACNTEEDLTNFFELKAEDAAGNWQTFSQWLLRCHRCVQSVTF